MNYLKNNEEGYIDDVEQSDEDAMICLYHAYSSYKSKDEIVKELMYIFKVSEEVVNSNLSQLKEDESAN